MLQTFKKLDSDVDFITLNGDLIGHGISNKDASSSEPAVEQEIRDLHAKVQALFTQYFPTKPVFFTFGNNDCYYHDSAPFKKDKAAFYSYMYNLWFQNHPANKQFAAAAQSTFMDGGYYRADVSSTLSILAYNTLENNPDQVQTEIGPEKENGFQWLEKNLSEQSNRKFLILTHIYAGARHAHSTKVKADDLWNTNDS